MTACVALVRWPSRSVRLLPGCSGSRCESRTGLWAQGRWASAPGERGPAGRGPFQASRLGRCDCDARPRELGHGFPRCCCRDTAGVQAHRAPVRRWLACPCRDRLRATRARGVLSASRVGRPPVGGAQPDRPARSLSPQWSWGGAAKFTASASASASALRGSSPDVGGTGRVVPRLVPRRRRCAAATAANSGRDFPPPGNELVADAQIDADELGRSDPRPAAPGGLRRHSHLEVLSTP
jgi:hypothetical protein